MRVADFESYSDLTLTGVYGGGSHPQRGTVKRLIKDDKMTTHAVMNRIVDPASECNLTALT